MRNTSAMSCPFSKRYTTSVSSPSTSADARSETRISANRKLYTSPSVRLWRFLRRSGIHHIFASHGMFYMFVPFTSHVLLSLSRRSPCLGCFEKELSGRLHPQILEGNFLEQQFVRYTCMPSHFTARCDGHRQLMIPCTPRCAGVEGLLFSSH